MPYLAPETIANYLGSGPGPASMGRAADQWGLLCSEIMDLESRFNRMLVGLATEWSGPAALQLFVAATPLQRWLNYLGYQLGVTTNQIASITSAYVQAQLIVVRTATIDTNRTQRALLLVGDPLGLNANAIALLDDEYERYWARNGRVWEMYKSVVSKALSKMTPFPSPAADRPQHRIGHVGLRIGVMASSTLLI